MSAIDTINLYLEALESGKDPFIHLADDFQFNGPLLRAKSKAEFLKGLAAMGPMQPKFEMLKQFEDQGEVCSVYNFMIGTTPVLMAEWSVVRSALIQSQRLIYDTKAFETAITN